MSYTGLSGANLRELMHGAMDDAVRKTGKRVEVTAKKMAPQRKIFKSGRPAEVTRTFVDEGLPKSFRKAGTRATRKVVTQTVKVHRGNKASTSSKNRQDFRIVTHAEAHERKIVMGNIIETLKPGVVEVHSVRKGEKPTYAMFEGGGQNLSARGRYEVAHAISGYQASLAAERNINPVQRRITEAYVPGKIGGYPRGAKLSADGKNVSFMRVTSRQTIIRVRDEASIRKIVATAGRQKRAQAMPRWNGPRLYKSKPTAANPNGQWREPTEAGSRKASAHKVERWSAYEKKTKAAVKANKKRDDTFGGLGSRVLAASLTPYDNPAFGSATLGTHFKLQVGGHLRQSIHMLEGKDSKVSISTDVYYAVYQEFGTSHNVAHPFLRPALYENRQFLISAAKDKARRALSGAGKG